VVQRGAPNAARAEIVLRALIRSSECLAQLSLIVDSVKGSLAF
jgi:hypothetical protein